MVLFLLQEVRQVMSYAPALLFFTVSNLYTESQILMPKWLELGYFSGHALVMLEQVLLEVYLPLLNNTDFNEPMSSTTLAGETSQIPDGRSGETDRGGQKGEGLKSEFVVSMQKFASQIAHTAQQVAGKTRLKIPDDLIYLQSSDVADVAKDPSAIKSLEKLAEEWIETVTQVVAKELKKVPVGNVCALKLIYGKISG